MKNKLIIRMSNDLGNQMFMYAFAYSFSRKINRELLIDNETAYNLKKNKKKFKLDIFNYSSKLAPNELKFLGFNGYIKRKYLMLIDKFKANKSFYIEKKSLNKTTFYNNDYLLGNYHNNLFIEGHFETDKYFNDCVNEIKREFLFKDIDKFKSDPLYRRIQSSESVCICIRQHRFSERFRNISNIDHKDSKIFMEDQIKYIKRAINVLKSKINNPEFYLWSNDLNNLDQHFPFDTYHPVNKTNIGLELFLMTQAKHFIVIPSTYNWWGAWLSNAKNKTIIRPSERVFTNFEVNNKDFWPTSWLKV